MPPPPSDLPLSKYLAPADFDQLVEELAIVDQSFTKDRPQHPMRRWEYAMALRASDVWAQADYEARGHANRMHGGLIVDVGGAGSPFWRMIGPDTCRVIDPEENVTLATYLRESTRLAHQVFCLSVLEHVEDLDEFLYHLACLTAPGGLLFLTMDCREAAAGGGDSWPVDDRHFHWMRKRIFTPLLIDSCVIDPLQYLGLHPLQRPDWRYPGPQVYDYTFASLALLKRR